MADCPYFVRLHLKTYSMNAEITKEFIFNYLAGKASVLQRQMIDEWIKQPAHEELFYKWLEEYEYLHPQYFVNLPAALTRFGDWADHHETFPSTFVAKAPVKTHRANPRWPVAAALLAGLLCGSWLWRDHLLYQTYRTPFGQTLPLILSDNTRVTLNANSSLTVPRFGFGTSTREVFLQGEANFSVTHKTNNQRFVVKTEKGLEVVVLGTEFMVYARQQNAKIVLNKGKVQLRYQEGTTPKQVFMKPGDLVTFDQRNRIKKQVTTQPEKYAAWQENRFVFDDMTLREFSKMMYENYGLKVVFEDESLAKRTLVGSYQAQNADELLEIVSEVFGLKILRNNNTIFLTEDH
jgi:transmembrane sensor